MSSTTLLPGDFNVDTGEEVTAPEMHLMWSGDEGTFLLRATSLGATWSGQFRTDPPEDSFVPWLRFACAEATHAMGGGRRDGEQLYELCLADVRKMSD